MKLRYYLPLIALFFAFSLEIMAQEDDQPQRRTRTRDAEAAAAQSNTGLPDLTQRAKTKNAEDSKGPGHTAWLREIYRSIDLEKDNNASLYYPTQPIGNRTNLFSLIFNLLADGKVKAYKYLDGREIFTADYVLNFKEEILDKYEIMYTTQGNRFVVDPIDVPSSEILAYMIKEAFYFDQANGSFNSQVIAICPMLVRIDYTYGGETRDPLFWIPYEEIKPYLSRELIMTSNYNNALTYTMDDYFMKRMYTGEIIKTTNLMNESLAQQVSRQQSQRAAEAQLTEIDTEIDITVDGDEELIALEASSAPVVEEIDYYKLAQDSIERSLWAFRDSLWVYNDSIAKAMAAPQKKDKKEKTAKAPKSKSSGGGSSSSAPAKSVRRGR